MNLEGYPYGFDFEKLKYEFYSVGPERSIKKVVEFFEASFDLFILSFGDWNELLQKIDDLVRSGNKDKEKVLRTIANIVRDFLDNHRGARIYAVGSTPARTRLYQIAINSKWNEINKFLDVKGYINGEWEPFANNKNYEAFMVKSKRSLEN